ncbi:MAG: helix-turn-helix transcriptional regulator, partial [Mycobacterium sp.]
MSNPTHGGHRRRWRSDQALHVADPTGAKKLIDDASRTTPPRTRSCIEAFLTVYWAAMGKPETARASAKRITWDQLPDVVACATAWGIAVASGDAGRSAEA